MLTLSLVKIRHALNREIIGLRRTTGPNDFTRIGMNRIGNLLSCVINPCFGLKTIEYKSFLNGNVTEYKIFCAGVGIEQYLLGIIEAMNYFEKEAQAFGELVKALQISTKSTSVFLSEVAKNSREQSPENIVIYLN